MATSKHPEMEHKTGAINQSARDNPLTGSAMQALARGWLAGTIGMPGDLEGLGRAGLNALGAGVDKHAALPTTDFLKEWLPGKQTGDENVATVGSMLGGVGVGTARQVVRNAAKAAPGALTQMARNAAMPRQLSAQAGVIKAPGGNWLTGSVEDALKGLKRGEHENEAVRAIRAVRPELSVEDARAFIQAVPVDPKDTALNAFIDKQLTRYVKNDMATERDPIRALAERGTLHVNPEQLNFQIPMHGKYLEEGQTAVAKSDAAKAWEGSSDMQIAKMKAGELLKGDGWFPDTAAISNAAERNPWLATKPEGTEVIAVRERMMPQDLGFDHLIDELRNATNPASGLPRELLLTPESLDRVSVPQAVEHVAKINAWREQQAILAKAAAAEGIPVHKEYKEGFKWLSIPDTEADKKALKYAMDVGCEGGWCTQGESTAKHYGGGEGGRLHVLVDKNGKAHVQIHERPSEYNKMRDDPAYAEAFEEEPDLLTPSITQIKGKGNKKPNDEYLPFVQDFVKSGKWSDVGDLQNTGLVPYTRGKQHVPRGLTGRTPMGVPFDEVGIPEGYYAEDELLNLMRQWQERSGNKPNFAEGGAVGPTDQQIREYYAQHKGDANFGEQAFNAMRDTGLTRERIDAALTPEALAPEPSYGGGDNFTPYDPETARDKLWRSVSQAQHTAGNRMSRDDFLKKYGTTFVADDKGGNAASEVAGQDVAEYYDKYLAPGAKGDLVRGFFDGPNPDGTYQMPDFGGGKYSDAHPYFDAWDNVKPHPESQLGNGFQEFVRQARPFAAMAAMGVGAGMLGGAFGGAAGASGTASGLAGTMGMAPGMAATALNTGALNTGMGLLRGQNIGDALRGGATSALLSPIGSMANTAATSAFSGSGLSPELLKALGTTVGSAATGGAQAVASGKPLGRGFIDGAVNGIVASAGNYIGGKTTGLTGNKFAGKVASSVTQSALRGKPLSIDALATQYATGKLTDLSGLDPSVAGIVVNLAKRKRPSATGALSALAKYSRL